MIEPKTPTHLPDLHNSIEMGTETLAIPQLISLLRSSLERSDLDEVESILTSREAALTEALNLKEAERVELQSRCDGFLRKCSELQERLGQKQREADNLKEEVKGIYIELVAEKTACEELRSRVSQLEKERGVIEISDSEGDDGKYAGLKKAEILEVKDEDFLLTPRLKRKKASRMLTRDSGKYAGLKTDDILEEKDEDFLLTPRLKRKRASRMVTSDSEDDEDNVPITELKKGKEEKQGLVGVTVNCFSDCSDQKNEDDVVEDDDVPIGKLREKSLGRNNGSRGDKTPSRKRLVKLGECSTLKDWDRGTPLTLRDSISWNPSHCKTNSVNQRSKRPAMCHQLVFSDAEGAREKEREKYIVDSESGASSLDGFIVDGSESDSEGNKSSSNDSSVEESKEDDSSDTSKEDSPSEVDLDDVLSTLRRKKSTKRWQYEADMLASFAENPEVCMKAICALYRQQTVEEQSAKETIVANNRGFSQADAFKASMIAEFLLDGDTYGPPKKSVKEFKKRYPDGLEYCRKIADHYSKQLFTIYQQVEDPFFLPS